MQLINMTNINLLIGTHDVQNVSVFSLPGGVKVTVDFIEGSTTDGLLVAVSNTTYFEYRQGQSDVVVEGLSSGEYSVTIFAMERSGKPFQRAVTLTRIVRIIEETTGKFKSSFKRSIASSPGPFPAFQCCTLKSRRAWYAISRERLSL